MSDSFFLSLQFSGRELQEQLDKIEVNCAFHRELGHCEGCTPYRRAHAISCLNMLLYSDCGKTRDDVVMKEYYQVKQEVQ